MRPLSSLKALRRSQSVAAVPDNISILRLLASGGIVEQVEGRVVATTEGLRFFRRLWTLSDGMPPADEEILEETVLEEIAIWLEGCSRQQSEISLTQSMLDEPPKRVSDEKEPESPSDSPDEPQSDSNPKVATKRGAPKLTDEQLEDAQKMQSEWQIAKHFGMCKQEFCEQNKITYKSLENARKALESRNLKDIVKTQVDGVLARFAVAVETLQDVDSALAMSEFHIISDAGVTPKMIEHKLNRRGKK